MAGARSTPHASPHGGWGGGREVGTARPVPLRTPSSFSFSWQLSYTASAQRESVEEVMPANMDARREQRGLSATLLNVTAIDTSGAAHTNSRVTALLRVLGLPDSWAQGSQRELVLDG